ncbi:hypothetical protein CerSpe_016200 [Prunus speciosa]
MLSPPLSPSPSFLPVSSYLSRSSLSVYASNAIENVVIIGSCPTGVITASYAAQANLKPLEFEGYRSGPVQGLLMTTTEVENFPGFPNGNLSRFNGQVNQPSSCCILD